MPPAPRLPPDVSALLASERAAPPPSTLVQARVLVGVQHAVLAGAGAGATAAWWFGRGAMLKGLAVVTVGTALAVGGWTMASHANAHARGAATTNAWTVRTVPPPAPRASAPTPTPPAVVAVQSAPTPPAVASVVVAHHEPAAAPTATHDVALQRENDLIEQAHAAIGQRDGRAAIAALRSYAREVHGARLGEESEVMWIQALVLDGDAAGARARAAQFLARHPGSAHAEGVEQLIANLP